MTKNLPRWPMLHQVEGRAIRTQQMIERLGVDPLQLVRLERGQAYCRVHEICLQCCSADACKTWLQSRDPEPAQPDFCPNLKLLLSCVASNGSNNDEES